MDMHIQVNDVNITLQDRPHSKEYVSLQIAQILVTELKGKRAKRVTCRP